MNEHDPAAGVRAEALRRERRWVVPVLVIAEVVALVGAAVLVAVLDDGSLDATGWWIVLGGGLALVILSNAVVLAIVWWRRRRRTRLFALSPLWELPTRRDRTALVRALRRGDPIAPGRRDLARRTARDLIGRRALVWLYLGLAVLMAVNGFLQLLAIGDSGPFGVVTIGFLGVAAVAMLANAGYIAWLIGRMRRALATLDAADPAA